MEKNKKNAYGFECGDILNIKDGHLNNLEVELIEYEVDKYAGRVVLKIGDHFDEYGIIILSYATLVRKGNGSASVVYIKDSNISKYLIEVTDFSKSKIDWQQEFFEEEGINIGITVFELDGVTMNDQDVCDELPELEELDLGEIYMDDSGFMGLASDLSVKEIKDKLLKAGFQLK